jgi:hypothetical protein
VDLRVPGPVDCPDIEYAPNTGAGEFEITAIGVTCGQATAVIRTVNDNGLDPSSGPGDYTTPDGYACSWTVSRAALPRADYRCARGAGPDHLDQLMTRREDAP